MNKKYLLALLLMGLFVILTCLIVLKASYKKPPPAFPDELPSFVLTTPDGDTYNTDSLHKCRIMVVFFSPDCLFCEHEGKELVRHRADFSEIVILFITNASADNASVFAHHTGIHAIPNCKVLVDTTYKIPRLLGLRTIPTTLLYNNDKKLIKAFEGEVNALKLLKTIHEHETEEE